MQCENLSLSAYNCRICCEGRTQCFQTEQHLSKTYTTVRCPRCKTVQTIEHYDPVSPDYVSIAAEQLDANHIWLQTSHKQQAFEQWWNQLKRLRHSEGSPRLLDIGCGVGGFLSYAAGKGLLLYGFDASSAQVDISRERFTNVRCATSVEDYAAALAVTNLKFDLVTMWDVLEHVRDPIVLLKSLSSFLSDDGLVFVSVPNGQGLGWKRLLYNARRVKMPLSPWEHVFYYSAASLRLCFSKAGFDTISTGAVVCYPRRLNCMELIRRVGYKALQLCPDYAPQIYLWSRVRTTP